MEQQVLKRTLTPLMLWGLGVGYVISGMYFGWNLGLEKGGTWGLAIATLFIILMYASFTFSYTELAALFHNLATVNQLCHHPQQSERKHHAHEGW